MKFLPVILIFVFASCSPCKKLADKICDCQLSQSQRTACKQNLDLQAQHKAFSLAEDKKRCEEILNDPECTCVAIQANQFEKCGLTR